MAANVTMTTKQKIIGVLTVVIVAFIIYEVIGLFSNGSTEPVNAPIKQASSTQPAQATVTTTTTAKTTAPAQIVPTPVAVISGSKDYSELQKQREQQNAYLDSVNQLQLLRVKKDIAEVNQAIAVARLAAETANKNMSDLLTQPAILPQAPAGVGVSVTPGTSANNQNTQQPNATPANAAPANAQILDIPFTVVSVSMQSNRWSAVLGYEDKLYSVIMGDSLFDGSKVISINKSGVTLLKDGKRRKISIQTTI
jgi:hypothetical protein